MRARFIAAEFLRKEAKAGVGRGLIAAGKGFLGSGSHISGEMLRRGVYSPTAHAVAKASPYAAALYGGVKAKEKIERSPTYHKLRYKLEERRQRKAMQQQQQGGR